MFIGESIKKHRNDRGMTQRELAEKCGYATGTIQQYENGKRQPRIEQLSKIAAALGVLPGDLLQDGLYPTTEELAAMKQAAETITDERQTEIEEKRLNNLIRRKAELLNNAGKQKAVDYMTDLSEHPKYRK